MTDKRKITRRQFFRYLLWGMVVPIGYLWNEIIRREINKKRKSREVRIPNDISQGITFYESMILIKEGKELKVFSSKCTHLGCTIKHQENGRLVCSCHGSRFDLNGNVEVGPAQKHLEVLPFKLDDKAGEIIVTVV